MSFLGNGIIGSALGSMLGGALDSFMSSDQLDTMPLPSFYFEVTFYSKDDPKFTSAKVGFGAPPPALGGLAAVGANMLSAATSMVTPNNMLSPGDHDKNWTKKAFIEVSGIELGIDSEQKTEGGNSYPINLPTKMKTQPATLKRLVRKKTIHDDWDLWISESLNAAANWDKALSLKIIQINVMYPNLSEAGKNVIVASFELHDAYPTKLSYGTLSSSSEELLTQEIEITYGFLKVI
jgi:phage tail-like protein